MTEALMTVYIPTVDMVQLRKANNKMSPRSALTHLLALNTFSFCTKNFSRASALLQNRDSLEL